MPPLIRRYTRAVPAALDVFVNATDDVTSLSFTRIPSPNSILDILNDPDPAALRYEIRLQKEGIETGRGFFTTSLNPASAGRVAVGPINISPANYMYAVAQRAGALTATSFIVKYATGF